MLLSGMTVCVDCSTWSRAQLMLATRDFGQLRMSSLLVNEATPEPPPFDPMQVATRFNFVATVSTIRPATARDRDHRCSELDGKRDPVNNSLDGAGSLRRKCRRATSWRETSEHCTAPTTPVFAVTTAAVKPISPPLLHCLIKCQVRRKRGPDVLKARITPHRCFIGQCHHNNFVAARQPCALIHNPVVVSSRMDDNL